MNFGDLHASWYDRWHRGKEYESEVDQLVEVFGAGVESVLDVGCGTARHLELLAKAGSTVTGVDRAPGMASVAASRLAGYPQARVIESDIAELDLDRVFDAVIMMFSVFGYHIADDDLLRTLSVVRKHLRPDGLLVFDVLDGATVLRNGVRGGFSLVEDGDEQLLRLSGGRIHHDAQIYETRMRLWMFDGSRVVAAAEDEVHPIRYFLPREVELILDLAGFALVGSAPLAGRLVGPTREWSRLFWARKKENSVD